MSTPGTVNYPTSLDDSDSLIRAGNRASTTLASTFSAGATTASLTSASAFPNSGTFTVDNEIVYYTGKSTNDLTGCVRGREGTSDATHTSGSTVDARITARHHTVLADAIIATQTRLNKVGRTMFFPEDYGATADAAEKYDAAITTGTALLSSVTAAFTSADVGKRVAVYGAGAAGATLRTSILSVAGGVATLNANAGTTVSGATLVYGTDNTTAFQSCFDAALATGYALVKLYPGVYLVETAPRTDRSGNCILSIFDAIDSQKDIVIEGAGPASDVDAAYLNQRPTKTSIIRTTRIEDSYYSSIASTLNEGGTLTAGDTTITLTSASSFPAGGGTVVIDNEVIRYASRSGNNLNSCTRGVGTTAATHADGSTVTLTYGPPSVIGGGTAEQLLTDSTHEYCGVVYLRDFAVQVPLNPNISGIDGLTFGGMHQRDMSAIAGTAGDAASFPTCKWSFGFRHPNRWCNGVNKNERAVAYQFYCGHAFLKEDHHLVDQGGGYRCVITWGFQPEGDGFYPIRLIYGQSNACQYDIGGWNAVTGVGALTRNVFLHYSTLQLEEAAAPFNRAGYFNDPTGYLQGDLLMHNFNGVNVYGDMILAGNNINTYCQNLRLRVARDQPFAIASAASLTVPAYADVCKITGTTTITSITASYAGRRIVLWFGSTAQVTDGSNLKLNGDFAGGANRTLTLMSDGTNWLEQSRTNPVQDFSAAMTFSQRSETTSNMVLPASTDYGILERLAVGSAVSCEIPATSSLTIWNVS